MGVTCLPGRDHEEALFNRILEASCQNSQILDRFTALKYIFHTSDTCFCEHSAMLRSFGNRRSNFPLLSYVFVRTVTG